jgi:hypothetical protein
VFEAFDFPSITRILHPVLRARTLMFLLSDFLDGTIAIDAEAWNSSLCSAVQGDALGVRIQV